MKNNDIYSNELKKIIHRNRMYDYEEVNMAFIAAKLINLQSKWGKKLELILRSDFIEDKTYWFIRYFRSKNVEPLSILSTVFNKNEYKDCLGVPIVAIDEMTMENTKDKILIVVNRESDRNMFSQKDYRESDYGFCFRARGELQFARERSIENYYYIVQNEDKYYEVLNMLEDKESKESFLEVIRSLIENDIYRYNEYPSDLKYFDDKIYKPLANEVWVNCGSCTGDTILHYLELGRKFKKIYAVEIESNMIGHLKKMFELLPKEISEKIITYNKRLGDNNSDCNINNVYKNEIVTLINMDIEGAELEVLSGGMEKIRSDRPVLAIAAYHKAEDLLCIPKLICGAVDGYHIFFRKYRGYCPDAMNEYIYYAVPTERVIK